MKKVSTKDKFIKAHQIDGQKADAGEIDFEVGFFHELGSTFKSNEDDIRKNYLVIAAKIL